MISQIKAGAIMSYISLFITILIGIIYTPWMISSIGKPDYGLYVLAMSVINIFVFDFGLGNAVQRFVSKYLAEGRLDKVNQFLSVTYKLYIIADVIIFLVLISVYFFIPNIFQGLSPEELVKFEFIYAVVAIFSIFSFPFVHLDGTILAHEKFVQLKLCDLLYKILIASSMTIFLYFGYGLYALVLVNVVAGIVRIGLKLIVLKRFTEVKVNWEYWDNSILKAIIAFSMWVTIYAISQRGVLSVAPSILGIYYSSEYIALLGVAIAVEGYFFLFANAINGLFLPKVSRLIANKEADNIIELMIKVGRIQIFMTSMIYIGLISFGKQFINLWVGEEFSIVYICSIIMILPSYISLPQQIAYTTIIAQSKVKYLAYSGILKVLTSLLFVFPLAKYYGVLGVSVSVAIAYSVSIIFNNIVYIKILKLDIKKFFLASFLRLLPSLLLALCFGLLVDFIIDINKWHGFIIKIVIFVCIYIALFFLFGLAKQEKLELVGKVKKIINIK
ncbi:polysaccharide biosynthesis C-terminal domain-containing protein [Polaribacter sp. P097]|uniref:polysaccharide biosynthesis C-terminal domain-containing protein n=1 Tax=Polaribacter sp. P097 TaxID=3117398 RepID=UPI002FE2B66A